MQADLGATEHDDEQPLHIDHQGDDPGRKPSRTGVQADSKNLATMPMRKTQHPSTSMGVQNGTSSVFDPKLVEPSVAQRALTIRMEVTVPAAIENELVAILTGTPHPDETIEVAFTRKEHELRGVLARLTPLEARALHRRLSTSRGGDVLAMHFTRLVAARRTRLLSFLADARRREAVAAARR